MINGATVVVEGDRARYLGRVLRLRTGDAITVFDGTGPEWPATIAGMTKSTVTLELGDGREAGAESPLKIHLVQGISRGERMDFVVQKATELGVKRVTPVLTEYGVVKLDGKPVPYAEVEVEYYNEDKKAEAPTDYMVTQTIKADQNGVFSYAAPKSGWWGFAALNTADYKLKADGVEKDVELGAVIWVKFEAWQAK